MALSVVVDNGTGLQGYLPGDTIGSAGQVVPGGYGVDTSGGGYTGGYSGYTSGGSYSAPADPYAQWGGQANYNRLVAGFNQGVQNVRDTSGAAAQNAALGQTTAYNQYIDSLKQQQNQLDAQQVQNYLGKQSGAKGITDWVGQGIRSGGVMLANKNASNSSAGDAIARAYGQLGRQQMAGVNGQFAQAQNQVQSSEQTMANDIAAHVRDLPAWKQQTVNSIVSDAQNQLAQLQQTANYESLPNKVNMAVEKQNIMNDAYAKLQGLDQVLSQANNVKAAPAQDLQARANTLFQAGTAPDTAFTFDASAPSQFQGTGPFASDLPLFTLPSSKKTSS